MNHKELINIATTLGYRSITDAGLCRGFNMMWAQAVCAGDLDSFKERMLLLDNYKSNPQELFFAIEQIRNKLKGEQLRGQRGYIPTPYEQQLLEIPAFFDGVILFLIPNQNHEVFAKQGVMQTDVDLISRYTAPGEIGLKNTCATAEQYDKQDLANFLANLGQKLEGRTDVAIMFSASKHTVSARYLGNGQFEYIDTNSNINGNMTHWQGTAAGLADQLFFSLTDNEKYLPLTCSLVSPENSPEIDITKCRNIKPVTQLHSDRAGKNVFESACVCNDTALINRIDFKKVNINLTNNLGLSPLMQTYCVNSMDVFDLLINNPRSDLNFAAPDGTTILDFMVSKNDITGVSRLLKDPRFNFKAYNQSPLSPLHVACLQGNLEMVNLLLDFGANINAAKGEEAFTPLMIAASVGNLPLLKLLLDRGADCNIKDKNGVTAFDTALINRMGLCTALLFDNTDLDAATFGKNWSLKSLKVPLAVQIEILQKGLKDYIKQRTTEPEYGNILGFGYSNSEKIAAAQALLTAIDNPKVLSPELIKVLQNGRLGNIYSQFREIEAQIKNKYIKDQISEGRELHNKPELTTDLTVSLQRTGSGS